MTPEWVKVIVRPIRNRLTNSKQKAELSFWRSRFDLDHGRFVNDHYERLMLGMAEESSDDFLKAKIVADFGCGPRGSLVWASSALLRIGIDVLADRYADEFTDNITSHEMIYLKSTEKVIPLPSGFIDVIFTMNAIDHVDNFSVMCDEVIRVLKPGGEFIGSFNLEERASSTEPQQLSEELIEQALLSKLEVQSYRVTGTLPEEDSPAPLFKYAPFFGGSLSYEPGQEGFLWVRARKPRLNPQA